MDKEKPGSSVASAESGTYWCEVCSFKFESEADPTCCPKCGAERLDIVQIFKPHDREVECMQTAADSVAGD